MIEKFGTVAKLNPATGEVSIVGFAQAPGLLWAGLARDSNGKIYSANGDNVLGYSIYEIDPDTGQATFVVQTALIGLGAMAFDSGDVLYAYDHRNGPVIDDIEDLLTIDLVTGATTFIGDLTTFGRGRMDFFNGNLWTHNVSNGLSVIDLNTALPTDVNPFANAIPFSFPDAFCISPEGSMYYVGIDLWILDSTTGATSRGPELSFYSLWAGAVFLEDANEPFALWFGGLPNSQMEIHVAGAAPFSTLTLLTGTGHGGSTNIPAGFPCSGLKLNLKRRISLIGTVTTDIDGRANLGTVFVPAAAIGQVSVQAINLSSCAMSNAATIWN